MFRQECEQFVKMGIHEKLIYILIYEGPLVSQVAKIVHGILSVKRDVSVWHMYWNMWYSAPRGVCHSAYINQYVLCVSFVLLCKVICNDFIVLYHWWSVTIKVHNKDSVFYILKIKFDETWFSKYIGPAVHNIRTQGACTFPCFKPGCVTLDRQRTDPVSCPHLLIEPND